MKAMTKLDLLCGAITVLAFLIVTLAMGFPVKPAQLGIALLCALGFAVLIRFALPLLIPSARRADSHWHTPLSETADKRIMAAALRTPFYLAAVVLAVVVVMVYFRGSA